MAAIQTMVNEICPTTTQSWIQRGALLVDVRENDEVEQLSCDVPNIIYIPLSEFEIRYKTLPFDKEMVIVSRTGGRSLRAAGFLINNGYDRLKVVSMKHGVIRWVQKGFPAKGETTFVNGNNNSACCCGSATPEKKTESCCGEPNNDGSTCC